MRAAAKGEVIDALCLCAALQALEHYEVTPGPHQKTAASLHASLRENIVNTVYQQYKATGFLWENYDSKVGKGRGTHPFTGWTILSDQY